MPIYRPLGKAKTNLPMHPLRIALPAACAVAVAGFAASACFFSLADLVVVSDAGGDAMGSSDHAPSSWCDTRTPTPVLCADFDQGPLTQGWAGGPHLEHGGVASLDNAVKRSPPNSFLSRLIPDTSKAGTVATLDKTFVTTFREAIFEFDFLADDSADAYMASISTSGNGPGAQYYVSLMNRGGGGLAEIQERMPEKATDVYSQLSMPVPIGQWTRVSIVLHLPDADAGASGWLTIRFDALVALDRHPVTSSGAWGAPSIALGLNSQYTWHAHFDNVTLDLQ
jgi:hypothetical protein